MRVDINTTILILGGSHLIQVLFFIYQFATNKNIKGPGWWLIWSIFETLAFFFILVLNVPLLQPLITILQGMLLVSGTLCIYIGMMRFFDKKINLTLIAALFVCFSVLHLYFILIDNEIVRSIIVSGSISITSFVTAISIYKYKTPAIARSAHVNAAIGVIQGVIFLYRTIMTIPVVRQFDILSPSVSYSEAFFVGLLWTFGLIIMLNRKLNSETSEAKSHFEQIFNSSPDAVIITSFNEGLVVDCNETFTKATGYTKEEIIGKSSLDVHLWKESAARSRIINMLREKGSCENLEEIFLRKNGEELTVLFSARIIIFNGIPHILSYTRDITGRKKIEEEIRLKNKELKKMNLEKDKFFSIIAHDLRNPLSAFLGFTEMMVEELPEMTNEELQKIGVSMRDASANLYSLLENLLEWSKINRGFIRFNPVYTELFILVKESLAILTDPAMKKNLEISYNIPSGISAYVDVGAFHTIIRNLLSNAVKFTPRGGKITVSAIKNLDESVEISVMDTGIGMNKKIVNNLFRLDAQINRKGTDGELSTGLGLILCKELIEMHGGLIRVESEEGKGTVFHFTIPGKPD